jgi:hypothetical protein
MIISPIGNSPMLPPGIANPAW